MVVNSIHTKPLEENFEVSLFLAQEIQLQEYQIALAFRANNDLAKKTTQKKRARKKISRVKKEKSASELEVP